MITILRVWFSADAVVGGTDERKTTRNMYGGVVTHAITEKMLVRQNKYPKIFFMHLQKKSTEILRE